MLIQSATNNRALYDHVPTALHCILGISVSCWALWPLVLKFTTGVTSTIAKTAVFPMCIFINLVNNGDVKAVREFKETPL